MPLTLLLGGARSGKSALAAAWARGWAGPVTFVATGEPGDAEMADRIAQHRADRPADWTTVEEPLELVATLQAAPRHDFVIVDCLTLWVSNLAEHGHSDAEIQGFARTAAGLAAARQPPTVVVSNEVGSGIVPAFPATRRYRDLLGTVNAIWAAAADRGLLVVAGQVLPLSPPEHFGPAGPKRPDT